MLAVRMGKFPSEIDDMPWPDFLELVALNSISPIGDERADIVGAVHTAAIVNTVRAAIASKDNPFTPVNAEDLMPFREVAEDGSDGMYVPEDAGDEMDAMKTMFMGMRFNKG